MGKSTYFIRILALLVKVKRGLLPALLTEHKVGALYAEGIIMVLIMEAFGVAKWIDIKVELSANKSQRQKGAGSCYSLYRSATDWRPTIAKAHFPFFFSLVLLPSASWI